MVMTARAAATSALSPEYLAEDDSAPLYHLSIVFAILQTIFFVLFYISRYLNNNINGADVWFLIPIAYLACMMHSIDGILLVKIGGAGRHAAALMLEDPNKIVNWLKLSKAEEYAHQVSITAPKLAILVLYARIFTTRKYRMAFYITGGFVIASMISVIITSSVLCRPFAFNWDKTIPGGKCADIMSAYRYTCFPNIIADLVILILPMPAIYKLRVDTPVKIGLFITFVTGSIGMVTSFARLVQMFTVDLFADITFNSVTIMIWTMVEPGTYLIAACMPSLRPLKQKLFPNFHFTSAVATKYKSTGAKGSWGQSSNGQNQIFRKREIDVHTSKLSQDEASLTNSTSGFNLNTHGYLELDDLHDGSQTIPSTTPKQGQENNIV